MKAPILNFDPQWPNLENRESPLQSLHQNRECQSINMQMERLCAILYLLALAMFDLSYAVCKKCTIEMSNDLDLDFLNWSMLNINNAHGNALRDFLFVDNSNVCSFCHRSRDINSQIDVHDHDPDL